MIRPFSPRSTLVATAMLLAGASLLACAPKTVPPQVAQAQAIAQSPAAAEAKELAPQILLEAEKHKAEAEFLLREGHTSESAAAAAQAIATYNYAFALTRVARAEERIVHAQAAKSEAESEQARIDQLAAQVAADADAYEMRARVHLDQEQIKDVKSLTPERAQMRRIAAKQLAAEARLLCLASEMLKSPVAELSDTTARLATLEARIAAGSSEKDIFVQAADLRASCLRLLTLTRRPVVKKAPESAAGDQLLTALTETNLFMSYRDDRGIVVNIGSPLDSEGNLSATTQKALQVLGGTAQAHREFPVLLVVHTALSGQETRAERMGELGRAALLEAGAPNVTVHSVGSAQPVVSTSLAGADSKNERIEVVFVSKGR